MERLDGNPAEEVRKGPVPSSHHQRKTKCQRRVRFSCRIGHQREVAEVAVGAVRGVGAVGAVRAGGAGGRAGAAIELCSS